MGMAKTMTVVVGSEMEQQGVRGEVEMVKELSVEEIPSYNLHRLNLC